MANVLFDFGREGIADGSIDILTDDLRVMLVLNSYTLNQAHKFVADIGAVDNGRSAALASKAVPLGVFDAADTTAAATAATSTGKMIIFKHTGSDATARLLGYLDTVGGLPMTPAAAQVLNIAWDNGANKILKI